MITAYFLQAIDKGTLSFSSNNWLMTCIYIAILVVEYPQSNTSPFAIIVWGTVLASHAACTNFTGLVTVRTLLGIFESAYQPSFVVLSAMRYRREEQAARVTYWYMVNGAQQIVGGLLAYLFTLISTGPLYSWQWLFLSYGIVAIIFGVFVFFWMPDSPMRAHCFSEEDKFLMVEHVRHNQTGLQNRRFKMEHAKDAVTDPQTWCYAAIQLTTTLPTSEAFIIIILLASVWLVKKTRQNILVMLGFIVFSFVGTILLLTIPNTTFAQHVGLLISYHITLSSAINFVFWATGNAIGLQVFLSWDAPRYHIAFATHLGCYTLLVLVLLFCFRWYLKRENKKRDKLAAEGVRQARDENMAHAFEDLTDRGNPNFRYMYLQWHASMAEASIDLTA
ncbi:major facilitator superfamily domain-containing protein [Xylariaceae sp. FL0255]|nr:major facilitator superfamily domain-containing protein [Xylariaceae sp. FL0255]